MKKLIELIERHRDKFQRKWTKGSQLRDNNSEHYDAFLHGESVGATKAYNNVLQWMKNPSITTEARKDISLTWKDINTIERLCNTVRHEFPYGVSEKAFGEEVLRLFNQTMEETK